MQNNILFSIIIPFYETIDYVKETIDSIINQQSFDLNNVEVIVVNDGSKHDVRSVLSTYSTKLPNFSIFDKENGNWGSVVNYVKQNKLAHGRYLTILDSDDKFAPTTLSIVSSYVVNSPDLITSHFYRWFSKENKKHKILVHWLFRNRFFDEKQFAKKKYLAKSAYSFPICKFYKTSMFYESDLILKEKISYQDVSLYHEMVEKAKTWQFINKCLGYYRSDRPDSSSNIEWSTTRIKNWIWTINYLDSIGSTSNAYMYCIYTPFRNACKTHSNDIAHEEITLHKKYKLTYISRLFHPAAKLVFKRMAKKMAKYSPIKFI